jgi:hypothetical protein
MPESYQYRVLHLKCFRCNYLRDEKGISDQQVTVEAGKVYSGKKKKRNRPSEYTGCEAEIMIRVHFNKKKRVYSGFYIDKKIPFYGHNHDVSPKLYKTHHRQRKIPLNDPTLNALARYKVLPRRLREYVRGNTEIECNLRDVYNFKRYLKRDTQCSENVVDRVQDFFKKNFQLEVSVKPSWTKRKRVSIES